MLGYFREQTHRKKYIKLAIILVVLITSIPMCYFISVKISLQEDIKSQEDIMVKVGITEDRGKYNYTYGYQDMDEYYIYSQLKDSKYIIEEKVSYDDERLYESDFTMVEGYNNQIWEGDDESHYYPLPFILIMASENYYEHTPHHFNINGEKPMNYNECIISKEFATKNSLEIGDTISLISNSTSYTKYNFEIVGLYSDSGLYTKNYIYTHIDTLIQYDLTSKYLASEYSLYLKDFDNFENQLYEITMENNKRLYVTEDTKDSYQDYMINKATLAHVESLIRYLAIAFSLILIVSSYIFLKIEVKEINIMRNMGVQNNIILKYYTFEILLISIFCIFVNQWIISSNNTYNKLSYLSYYYDLNIQEDLYWVEPSNHLLINTTSEDIHKPISTKNKEFDYDFKNIVFSRKASLLETQHVVNTQKLLIWEMVVIIFLLVTYAFRIYYILTYDPMKKRQEG